MKKRLFGTILAAALIVSQAVTTLAAGSVSGQVDLPDDYSGYYEITEATEESFADVQEADPEVYEKIMAVNEGTETLQSIAEQAPELEAELEGKEAVTPFFDLSPINGGVLTEDGRYRVMLSVPVLTNLMRNVRLLHYSVVRNVWEIITPENVDYANRRIEAIFDDFSPVAVIADVDAASSSDTVTGSAQGTSPKTGMSNLWMLWAGAAAVLTAAGVLTYRKARQ